MDSGLAQIAINTWLPAIVAAVAGGYFAKVILPIIYENYVRAKKVSDRRVEHAETIAMLLSGYIVAWGRLLQISKLGRTRNLSDEERQRKLKFVEDRNQNREELYKQLSVSRFYFGNELCGKFQQFVSWDEELTAKRVEDLPELSAWKKWEDEILVALKRDLNATRR